MKERTRKVLVPKDKQSEIALDFNEPEKGEFFEFELDEFLFLELYKNDFFEMINEVADSNVDDYEEDSIDDRTKLQAVVNSLRKFQKTANSIELSNAAQKIEGLFLLAIKNETSVHFQF